MAFLKLRVPLAVFLLAPLIAVSAQTVRPVIDGELMLRAFQHSFPGKTGEVEFRDGDWTIQAGGEIVYWAGGRLLPGAERDAVAAYSPHPFEIYPAAVPSPAIYSAEYTEALRLRGTDEALRDREDRHRRFQAILYGGIERREIEALLERIDFLGKRITVHRDIAASLGRIDAEIRGAAQQGNAAFIASIDQIGGYNWREIHGTRQMSYHSWGLAIDIQPKRPGGQAVYWLWERSRNEDWMLIPLERRWKPPDRVIEAFEREGFIWGGKWPLYDTMHFEYRPELHELNRLLLEREAGGIAGAETAPAPGQDLHHLYPSRLIRRGTFREQVAAFIARLRSRGGQ
jgi:hypothetical protein